MTVFLYTDADVFAGTERHILTLASALRRSGVKSSVICPGNSPLAEKCREQDIEAIPVEKRGLWDNYAIQAIKRLIAEGEPAIVHAHNGRCLLNAALATRGRSPLVFTQHFLQPNHTIQTGLKGLIYTMVHSWVNRRVNAFIAVSQVAANLMMAREGIDSSRVYVIPNGIDPVSHDELTDSDAVRSALSLPPGVPLVLSLARLEAEKGIENLVEAAYLLKQGGREVCIIVAGDGSLRGPLEQKISDINLDNIRLIGFHDDALALVSNCDIFILPSPAEPFGLVLLEAMALRKPVIAVNAGGPAEIIVNGETGLLAPSGSPQDLAMAIEKLLSDTDARSRLGEAGYRRFLKHYTATAMAAKTIEVYRSLSGRLN